jgi:beta-lactamase superfamily II metal-dependent hydrolase
VGLPTTQQLAAAPLSIAVFGPGFGESILLRAEAEPPQWAVIDSARRQRRRSGFNPALETLMVANAQPSLVILTHPHRDHTAGLSDVIEYAVTGAVAGAVEPLLQPPSPYAVMEDPDDEAAQTRSQTRLAHIAIRRGWESGRLTKWAMRHESAVQTFAGWKLTVLGPAQSEIDAAMAAMGAGGEPNLNDLSAALLVEKNGVRVVLAADGEKAAWEAVDARIAPDNLRNTRPIKVPHHGSRDAIHHVLIDCTTLDEGRPQAVTPFPSSGRLPRFEPDQGADLLLRAAGALLITALPVDLVPLAEAVAISQVRAAMTDVAFGADPEFVVREERPGSTETLAAQPRDPAEAWVLLGIHLDGRIDVTLGEHAVRLTP